MSPDPTEDRSMTNATRMMLHPGSTWIGALAFTLAVSLAGMACLAARAAESKVPLSFSGGHDLGPKDYGRPVALIAAGLGVEPDVFRKAFSGVTPSRNGPPSGELARRNKAALMKVLGPHGVTNERLDEVSNYYRFQPQRGRIWPTTPAEAQAIVEGGKIKQIVVTSPGSGYCSPPTATVPGLEGVTLNVTLRFDKDLRKNGAIGSIEVAPPDAAGTRR
jgi:hypothetical protein